MKNEERINEPNRRTFLKKAALAGFVTTFGAGTAYANESGGKSAEELAREVENADNPEEAFRRLSKGDQKKVVRYLTVTDHRVEVTDGNGNGLTTEDVSAMASGCKSVTANWIGVNGSGEELYRYNQLVDWCYDGSTVSNTYRRRWGDTDSAFWQFVGHKDNTERGGDGNSFYESWTQGHFRLCAGGNIGCVQNTYPWIETLVRSDGSYTTDSNEGSQL
ncbi:hypothetical protein [Halorussus lipolyticus]|uniref:hypothetical protein n=1 Tax=Halorussus lipolyticus TaxID=3034024 RepID=UPI0023E87514|nr:hypothetical protein [Halorussus sp. DT80]